MLKHERLVKFTRRFFWLNFWLISECFTIIDYSIRQNHLALQSYEKTN